MTPNMCKNMPMFWLFNNSSPTLDILQDCKRCMFGSSRKFPPFLNINKPFSSHPTVAKHTSDFIDFHIWVCKNSEIRKIHFKGSYSVGSNGQTRPFFTIHSTAPAALAASRAGSTSWGWSWWFPSMGVPP